MNLMQHFSAILAISTVILAAIAVIHVFNSLIHAKNNIFKAWSNIDVLLKQRHDEIPNLVSIVKGYIHHEKSLLAELAEIRSEAVSTKTLVRRQQMENEITGLINSIYAYSENYPRLKSGENFIQLQKRLTRIEECITDRREFYNESVRIYNTKIEKFPDIIFSSAFKFKKARFLNISTNRDAYSKVFFDNTSLAERPRVASIHPGVNK
jgi:LemA protein